VRCKMNIEKSVESHLAVLMSLEEYLYTACYSEKFIVSKLANLLTSFELLFVTLFQVGLIHFLKEKSFYILN